MYRIHLQIYKQMSNEVGMHQTSVEHWTKVFNFSIHIYDDTNVVKVLSFFCFKQQQENQQLRNLTMKYIMIGYNYKLYCSNNFVFFELFLRFFYSKFLFWLLLLLLINILLSNLHAIYMLSLWWKKSGIFSFRHF